MIVVFTYVLLYNNSVVQAQLQNCSKRGKDFLENEFFQESNKKNMSDKQAKNRPMKRVKKLLPLF